MATTEADICNLALGRVRANPIGSLLEQSVQAEQCRIFYPNARDEILSMVDWPFNRSTIQLALKTEKPAEWEYGYAYPADCLTVRYLLPSEDSLVNSYRAIDDRFVQYEREEIAYTVEIDSGDKEIIATNQASARAVFSKRVKDVRLYKPLVENVIAWRLAVDLATPLGGDSGQRYAGIARAALTELLEKAEAVYKNQSSPRQTQKLPRSIAARTNRQGIFNRR